MKKIGKIIGLITLMILITGCSKQKTESDIKDYVKTNFGTAEMIKSENINEKRIAYFLKDNEYQFEYRCESYLTDFNMDNSSLFNYSDVSCNFKEKYQNYIYEQLKLEKNLEIPDSKYDKGQFILFFQTHTNQLDNNDYYSSLLKEIEKIDHRKYFQEIILDIYQSDSNEKLGSINNQTYQLMTPSQEKENELIEYANRMFSKSTSPSDTEIKLTEKKEIVIKENPDIYNKLKQHITSDQEPDLESATTTIYYFYDTTAKIDFFVIDYVLNGQACFYTNYDAPKDNYYNKYSDCQRWWQ